MKKNVKKELVFYQKRIIRTRYVLDEGVKNAKIANGEQTGNRITHIMRAINLKFRREALHDSGTNQGKRQDY